MANVTTNQDAGNYTDGYDVEFDRIGASAVIPADTLAVNDGGVAKAFTSALYVAGAKLLGRAHQRYVETAGVTGTQRMTFRRGCPMDVMTKTGDPPVRADVGGLVYMSANFEAQHTAIGSGLAVICTYLSADGKSCRVQLP